MTTIMWAYLACKYMDIQLQPHELIHGVMQVNTWTDAQTDMNLAKMWPFQNESMDLYYHVMGKW